MAITRITSDDDLDLKHPKTNKMANAQDRDNCLAFFPSHLLCEFYASNKITRTTGTEEQTIVLNEIPRHCDGFYVGDSVGRSWK